jgi:hypothetical protein
VSREVSAALVAGLVLAGAVLALGLGLGGSSEQRENPFAQLADGPTELGEAVVVGKAATGGRSIFGMRVRSQTFSADVQLLAEEACHLVVHGGDPWPSEREECASDVPVAGEIVGLGRRASGESIVGVRVEITRACFDALVPGDGWPPNRPGCPGSDD